MSAPAGLIPLLSACNFVIGMGGFLVIGVLVPVASDLGLSTAQAGNLLTIYALAYAVFSPLLVSATGALGRRRVLALGLCVFAAGMALSAAASSPGMLFAARAISAAGAGMFTPVGAAVAAGLAPEAQRGRALAAVFFGLTLAQVLGVPAGSWIAYTLGWRVAFWLVLGLAMLGLWLVWHRVPAGLSFQPVSLRDLRRSLASFGIMLAVLFTASFLGAIYVVYTYVAPLLTELRGFRRDGITLALVVFGVGAVLGNLVGGQMADRLGPDRSLVLLCLAQIGLMPLFSVLPQSTPVIFGLILIWSISGWSFLASQQVRLLRLAPDQASVVLALNAAAIYIGAALGSAIGGQVAERFGLSMLGAVGGIAAFGALGHILWSIRQQNMSDRAS